MKFTPMAVWRTRISPSPGEGASRSSIRRTSGAPYSANSIRNSDVMDGCSPCWAAHWPGTRLILPGVAVHHDYGTVRDGPPCSPLSLAKASVTPTAPELRGRNCTDTWFAVFATMLRQCIERPRFRKERASQPHTSRTSTLWARHVAAAHTLCRLSAQVMQPARKPLGNRNEPASLANESVGLWCAPSRERTQCPLREVGRHSSRSGKPFHYS